MKRWSIDARLLIVAIYCTHLIHTILSTLWYFHLRQIIVVIYSMHCGGGAKCKFNDKHNECSVENADAAAAIDSIEIPHFMTPPEILLLIRFAFVFSRARKWKEREKERARDSLAAIHSFVLVQIA